MPQQTTPQFPQAPGSQDQRQTSSTHFKNFQDSARLFRFWWTPLGVLGVLLGFSFIWSGKTALWPVSGWAIALGPWGYDTIDFRGFLPELFLTLWLVPLTAVLLLGVGLARMIVRPLHWARIWAWVCAGLSLVILVVVASLGRALTFPFWATAASLIIAGLGLCATHPDRGFDPAMVQPRLSRRGVLLNLVGMAGLAAASVGFGAWLVERSLRAQRSRIAYTIPKSTDITSSYFYAFSWTPQKTFLMAQYEDHSTLDIWEIARAPRHMTTLGPASSYGDVAFAPNGRLLAVSSSDASYKKTSFIWDLQTGIAAPTAFWSQAMAWSPDSSRLAGEGDSDPSDLLIWDVARNRPLAHYRAPGNEDLPRQIVWSPDGQWLVVQEYPHVTTLRLYEVHTGKNVWTRTFAPLDEPIDASAMHLAYLAWSPDSRYLALPFTSTGFIRDPITAYPVIIWDVVEQRELLSYMGHLGGAHYVAWSPDGQYLASGGTSDATVQVWHAATGKLVFTFRGHKNGIIYVGWSPDGTSIASVDEDQVLIWDAPTL